MLLYPGDTTFNKQYTMRREKVNSCGRSKRAFSFLLYPSCCGEDLCGSQCIVACCIWV